MISRSSGSVCKQSRCSWIKVCFIRRMGDKDQGNYVNLTLHVYLQPKLDCFLLKGCVAGENVLVHVKGDITWIGVYSKTLEKVQPTSNFWQDPIGIPIEERPPEVSDLVMEEVTSGKHMEQVVEQMGPSQRGE